MFNFRWKRLSTKIFNDENFVIYSNSNHISFQVSLESVELHGRVAELESELREVKGEMEREQLRLAEEKAVAISQMQKQLNSTATER